MTFPSGPPHHFFMDRFTEAFRTELAAFVEVAKGGADSGRHRRRRGRGGLAGRGRHRVPAPGRPGDGSRRSNEISDEDRRCADFVGRLRGARLGLPADARAGARRDARRRADGDRTGPRRLPAVGPRGADRAARLARAGAASAGSCRWCCTTPTTIRCPTSPGRSRPDGAGAGVVVLAAATGTDGYDSGPTSTTASGRHCWPTSTGCADGGRRTGVLAVLHPHVGTMVETRAEVDRVLAGSAIPLCLDTGHLLIGGTDPLQLAARRAGPDRAHPPQGRRRALAARVQSGELTYTEAVRRGMYTPLGAGDVDIAGIVTGVARQRLRRLVRDGAGHHPRRRADRRRPAFRDVRASVASCREVCRSVTA